MHFEHDGETENLRSKILVVDDSAVIREPIAASLRHAGYLTLAASNGSEALEITKRERPDLVLLDLSMPVMDGLTFLKHLRAAPEGGVTPVILLTASNDSEHFAAAGKLGVKEFMVKSQFSLLNLMDRVSQQIARGTGEALDNAA